MCCRRTRDATYSDAIRLATRRAVLTTPPSSTTTSVTAAAWHQAPKCSRSGLVLGSLPGTCCPPVLGWWQLSQIRRWRTISATPIGMTNLRSSAQLWKQPSSTVVGSTWPSRRHRFTGSTNGRDCGRSWTRSGREVGSHCGGRSFVTPTSQMHSARPARICWAPRLEVPSMSRTGRHSARRRAPTKGPGDLGPCARCRESHRAVDLHPHGVSGEGPLRIDGDGHPPTPLRAAGAA